MQHAVGRRYKDESHIRVSLILRRQITPLTNFSAFELTIIIIKITRQLTPLHTIQVSAWEMIKTLLLNFVGFIIR